MKPLNWLTILLLCNVAVVAAESHSAKERFDQAQSLFASAMDRLQEEESASVETRQKFYESARLFGALAEDLAEEGVLSANLLVNTGNAFHFAGDNPRALLWYLRAEKLNKIPEIRRAIAALRRSCQADPWPHSRGSIGRALLFWHYDLSRLLKQKLFIVIYLVGCGCFLVCFAVQRRRVLIRLGIILLIAGAALGASDIIRTIQDDQPRAVVLETTSGYVGDGKAYSVVRDKIIPGQEVRLIESRKSWRRIRLPDETTCWLPAETVKSVPFIDSGAE